MLLISEPVEQEMRRARILKTVKSWRHARYALALSLGVLWWRELANPSRRARRVQGSKHRWESTELLLPKFSHCYYILIGVICWSKSDPAFFFFWCCCHGGPKYCWLQFRNCFGLLRLFLLAWVFGFGFWNKIEQSSQTSSPASQTPAFSTSYNGEFS